MSKPFDREAAFKAWWNAQRWTGDHGYRQAFDAWMSAWDAAARAAREECIGLIQKYIRFDSYQQHRHSWHDLQDLLERIRSFAAAPPRPAGPPPASP